MTTAPIMSVSISSESDISNVRNVARLSAQVLNFPVTDQARIGWAVANLGRLMLTLGYHDSMMIAHIEHNDRKGIRVTCSGNWIRLVRASWIEQTTLSDISQWVDEIHFAEGRVPQLMMVVWSPVEENKEQEIKQDEVRDNGNEHTTG